MVQLGVLGVEAGDQAAYACQLCVGHADKVTLGAEAMHPAVRATFIEQVLEMVEGYEAQKLCKYGLTCIHAYLA
jgi:hypothetical protein